MKVVTCCYSVLFTLPTNAQHSTLGPFQTQPDLRSESQSRALQVLAEAVSKTSTGKQVIDDVETRVVNFIENNLFFDKDSIATVLGATTVLSQGRVNTEQFNSLEFKVFNGKIRTDLDYDFINNQAGAQIRSEWSF